MGEFIESKSGVYKFILKTSGNLELFCRDALLWSSNTYDADVDVFQFQSGGNLVIKKINGTNAWESKTIYNKRSFDGAPECLIIQDDGDVVLYAGIRSKWKTSTFGKISQLVSSDKVLF